MRLIESLNHQEFQKNPEPDWFLVIIDNHPFDSARDLVEDCKKHFSKQIRYSTEPQKGIASARNTAIRVAKEFDLLIFIDDDEFADVHWIDELLYVQRKFDGDIVIGPVIPLFETHPPAWILKGRFFDRPRYKTGTLLEYARTGNMLIKSVWLNKLPGPFDIKFNLTGGEDMLFSALLRDLGAKIIWADDAIVFENNPQNRLSVNWLVKRAWRGGMNITRVDKIVNLRKAYLRIFYGFFWIGFGILILIPQFILFGLSGLVKSMRMIAKGCGELLGFFGVKKQAY